MDLTGDGWIQDQKAATFGGLALMESPPLPTFPNPHRLLAGLGERWVEVNKSKPKFSYL